jgi:hypothetical protein
MNWKKWIKKHWWKSLIPVFGPTGIIILSYIDKISDVKEIIEYENVKKTNRCCDCGRSDGPLFWLLTELGGNRFCSDCLKAYYELVLITNCSQAL